VRRKVSTSITKQCYLSLKKTVKISEEKLKNLQKCYNYLKHIDKVINYFNEIVQENKELNVGIDFENDNIIRVAEKLNPSVQLDIRERDPVPPAKDKAYRTTIYIRKQRVLLSFLNYSKWNAVVQGNFSVYQFWIY
jgi:hypothetical protein